MNKKIIFTLTLLIFFLQLLFPSVQPKTQTVLSPTTQTTHDSILYVGGNGPNNYTKIQHAIDNASSGQEIFVYNDSSPYYENLLIAKTITLRGEEKTSTIIDGQNAHHVITISADNVHLSELTIQYGGTYWSNIGVYITASDTQITHTIIKHSANGIFIEGGYNTTIKHTLLTQNNYHAIRLEYTDQNTIANNIITNNDNGIYLWESNNNLITNNIINNNNWEGIIIGQYCIDNHIYHNDFLGFPIEHAFDLSNNTWDHEYPDGGNYWQDYTGSDSDGDGIGDTPYIIRGTPSQDRYPLIEPKQYQKPDIAIDITGGFGLTIRFIDNRNDSTIPLFLNISTQFTYPFRKIIGLGDYETYFETLISTNEDIEYQIKPPNIFGFGQLFMTIYLDTMVITEKKTVVGMLLI